MIRTAAYAGMQQTQTRTPPHHHVAQQRSMTRSSFNQSNSEYKAEEPTVRSDKYGQRYDQIYDKSYEDIRLETGL